MEHIPRSCSSIVSWGGGWHSRVSFSLETGSFYPSSTPPLISFARSRESAKRQLPQLQLLSAAYTGTPFVSLTAAAAHFKWKDTRKPLPFFLICSVTRGSLKIHSFYLPSFLFALFSLSAQNFNWRYDVYEKEKEAVPHCRSSSHLPSYPLPLGGRHT